VEDKPMSILEHLEALRSVLIKSIIAVIPGTIMGWFIRKEILAILIKPVKSMGYQLVYIGATEAFVAEMKIAFFAGLAIASPVIAYQLWKFLLPALHAHEKKYLLIFVPSSLALFAGGIVFAYYSVFTYGIQFLLSFGGEGLSPMLSLGKYLSFAIWFLLPFGLMFEMPLVILILARLGIIKPQFLAGKRKWAFVIAFVIAAIATPTTDMITQLVMALAIYILYEISLWLAYFVRPRKVEVTDGEESADPLAGVGEVLEDDIADDVEEDRQNKGEKSLEEIYQEIVDRGSKDGE